MVKDKLNTTTTLKEMLLLGFTEKDSTKETIKKLIITEKHQANCGNRITMD